MVCAPFVDMNHHSKNVMFSCAFIMNERSESFEWWFRTFLKFIDGKFPGTIMTNQAFSMVVAIDSVFSNVQHRLCCFHIIENSRKHIGALRAKEGFTKLF